MGMEDRGDTRLTVGILAHVDAGKTTLAEGILYLTGGIRRLGRVDHGDAFLDTHDLEKARGITIFSKQARISVDCDGQTREITLLDTPGHVDFSAETERVLQVLDAAVLVISGTDGVQGHVETLWKLLRRYQVPTYLFINKMDQPGTDPQAVLQELRERLDENCVDFTVADCFLDGVGGEIVPPGQSLPEPSRIRNVEGLPREQWLERLSLCSEELMETYLEQELLSLVQVREAIRRRQIFPCFFGSALKMQGVEEMLRGIARYTYRPAYGPELAARVYKIERDAGGNRLTNLKVTGGSLKVKGLLGGEKNGEAGAVMNFCVYAMAIAGVVTAVLGLAFLEPLAKGAGADADNIAYTCDYLKWIFIGAPFIMLANGFVHLFRSAGLIKEGTIGLALGNAVNMALDYVFIAVLNWGTAGAALATSLGFVCASVYYMACMIRESVRGNVCVSLSPKRFLPNGAMVRSVVSIGVPGALITVLMSVSNIVLNNYISMYGSDAVASYGIAYRLDMIPILLSVGLSQGIAPLVGYCYGGNEKKRMSDMVKSFACRLLCLALSI